MPKFLAPINLNSNELQNAVIQNLGTAPTSPKKGQLYFDTASNMLMVYNGTSWVSGGMTAAQLLAALITVDGTGSGLDADTLDGHDTSYFEPAISKKSAFNVDFETTASNVKMNGTASVGSLGTTARADHIHPTDTSRAPLASPVFTGTPTAPTPSAGDNSTRIATTAYVDAILAAGDAMIFKGTLGTGGTLTATTFAALTAYNRGWTYKVITAGTYAGIVCEVGDLIIAITDHTSGELVASEWTVVQTNIDGAVTGPVSATDGNFPLFDGATGKQLKNSAYSPASFAPAGHNHDSIYPKMFCANIPGDGSTLSYVVHSSYTNSICQIFEVSTGAIVYPDIVVTGSGDYTIAFAVAPTAGQYRFVIIGY